MRKYARLTALAAVFAAAVPPLASALPVTPSGTLRAAAAISPAEKAGYGVGYDAPHVYYLPNVYITALITAACRPIVITTTIKRTAVRSPANTASITLGDLIVVRRPARIRPAYLFLSRAARSRIDGGGWR
jgi:hypothetical protein